MSQVRKQAAGSPPRYDLEDRTFAFARRVRRFVRTLKVHPALGDDCRQLVRASGSVGANYIEANEALGKKDFLMRIRICRKEAKESGYWLRLLQVDGEAVAECAWLEGEAKELTNIFGAILRRSEGDGK